MAAVKKGKEHGSINTICYILRCVKAMIKVFQTSLFNHRRLKYILYNGQGYWVAQSVAEALDYCPRSNGASSAFFRKPGLLQGKHFIKIKSHALRQFKSVDGSSPHIGSLSLLTGAGLWLALGHSYKPLALDLIHWLAGVALGELAEDIAWDRILEKKGEREDHVKNIF